MHTPTERGTASYLEFQQAGIVAGLTRAVTTGHVAGVAVPLPADLDQFGGV